MASRGRGRGREPQSLKQDPSQPTPHTRASRPGGAASAGKTKIPSSLQELNKYLTSLNESNFETYGGVFADMVLGYSSNAAKLREAVDLLFDTTVSNRDDAPLGAKVCERIVTAPACSSESDESVARRTDFRKTLLGRFQVEFSRKEETRARSIEAWLSVFAFLCEIYARVKVSDEPVRVVGKAILSAMHYLLDVDDVVDDEVDCVCTSLKQCGCYLDQQAAAEVEKLICLLRTRAISGKTNCRVRCLIMEVLELRQRSWRDPEGKLESFYVDALADAVAEDELRE